MVYEEATARCWAEIDLDEIRGNYMRACELSSGAQVVCVLKADAYGMGAPTVCQALMDCGAKLFAVASGDEAEELLTACPNADVLVLGLVGEVQMKRLIPRGCLFTLFSYEQGLSILRAAEAVERPARVHVKAETGLHRLGFAGESAVEEIVTLKERAERTAMALALRKSGNEAAAERVAQGEAIGCIFAQELQFNSLLQMEGLFTHLALHNQESDYRQFAQLEGLRDVLATRGIHFQMVHALDSIGMVRYPAHQMDAVRTGAWLYGVTPGRFDHPELCHAVAKLKARIAQIHDIPAGETIGYDDDHPLIRDSRIATLSAGYVDGVPRLNHVGEVEIRGKRAQVVGLVCMDQMMVDVTDIPDAAAGDEVVFVGNDISIPEYASWGRLNRNEALARFGRRVPKVYFEGGKVTKIVHRMEASFIEAQD